MNIDLGETCTRNGEGLRGEQKKRNINMRSLRGAEKAFSTAKGAKESNQPRMNTDFEWTTRIEDGTRSEKADPDISGDGLYKV